MKTDLMITEGVSGTWFYHLSLRADISVALCGARTMATQLPLGTWGHTGHLGERWCSRCEVASVGRQPGAVGKKEK